MDLLKRCLTSTPVLVPLDYSPSASIIVVSVDASTTIGWGAILQQDHGDGLLRPARYESGIWNDAERKYDAQKLECRGLLKALKKFRFWVYGRFFRVETDAQTLVWLLNQPPNGLPNAMMMRWLTFIRLFDFEVKHVPGAKNTGPDGLSQRGKAPTDEEEEDPDDFFDAKIYFVSAEAQQRSQLGGKEYFDRTHRIRMTPLAIGDLVLLPHSSIEQSHNKKLDRKLDNRWIGPYRIREVKDNGSYLLAELDGAKPRGSVGTAKPEPRSRNCGCGNHETRTMSAETMSFTILKPEL